MKDEYGREIDYVRISVTDRCNLRCVYCMPEEGICSISHDEILRFDEITHICTILAQMGIRKIKLTGGEPLVRRGLSKLAASLKKIPGIESLTLTTNGVLLEKYYDELAAAGVDAVTISLDTLDPQLYWQITRRDELEAVLLGLKTALKKGKMQVKINCVPIQGHEFSLKEQGIFEIAALARDYDIHVRFIEMMPVGLGAGFDFIGEETIKEKLEEKFGKLTSCSDVAGNGPCHYYSVPGFKGRIGFISAISHGFCSECNRVRLTSEGFLKTCLQYDIGVDLRAILRDKKIAEEKSGENSEKNSERNGGQLDDELKAAIEKAISEKPKSHHFDKKGDFTDREHRKMSQIGG